MKEERPVLNLTGKYIITTPKGNKFSYHPIEWGLNQVGILIMGMIIGVLAYQLYQII